MNIFQIHGYDVSRKYSIQSKTNTGQYGLISGVVFRIYYGILPVSEIYYGTIPITSAYYGNKLIFKVDTEQPEPAIPPAQIEYVTSLENTAGATTYTFTDANIAGPGLIVVGYHTERTGIFDFSSGTIGGIPATSAVTRSSLTTTGLMYSRITSGNTATITVSFSATAARCRISIWRILDNMSDSPFANSNTATSGTGLTLTASSINSNCVGIAIQTNAQDNTPVTWTNATLAYNLGMGGSPGTQSSGAYFNTTSTGNVIVSSSHSNSATPITSVFAIWR